MVSMVSIVASKRNLSQAGWRTGLPTIFPKQVSDLWGSGGLKAGQGAPGMLGLARAKNVVKTLEISAFTKIMLQWLQCGGRSTHAAAATATLFLLNLIKQLNWTDRVSKRSWFCDGSNVRESSNIEQLNWTAAHWSTKQRKKCRLLQISRRLD